MIMITFNALDILGNTLPCGYTFMGQSTVVFVLFSHISYVEADNDLEAESRPLLRGRDLRAAAKIFQDNDVNGKDFSTLTAQKLKADLGMSPFLAHEVLIARDHAA